MTEQEWLESEEPDEMLAFLRGKASDRKLRLLAAACVRSAFWSQLTHPRRKNAVEVAEQVADGLCTKEELGSAYFASWLADNDVSLAGCAAREAASPLAWDVGTDVLLHMKEAVRRGELDTRSMTHSAHLLRDLFGNPFRPVSCDSCWLTWNGGTIPILAQAVYEERELPSGHLDPVRLALLADMLEDAGCRDPQILDHLRGPGGHVRGCWVVDLLLGKG